MRSVGCSYVEEQPRTVAIFSDDPVHFLARQCAQLHNINSRFTPTHNDDSSHIVGGQEMVLPTNVLGMHYRPVE